MTAVGEIQTHQPASGLHDSLVDLQVCGTTTKRLNIDTPLFRVEVEGLESTPLAEKLNLVYVLVSTVVSSTRVTFGVLVGHRRAKGVEDSA